jgi:cysteine desulfurase
MPTVYLDYNATTPVDTRVLAAMMPWLTHQFGNAASRDHAFGWDAAEAVEEARDHVARLVNANSNEILFTGSATESINLALKGLAFALQAPEKAIMTSPTEHEAVLETAQQLTQQMRQSVLFLPVDTQGHITVDALEKTLSATQTLVVALMYANNEIGTLHPIQPIADLAHRFGALLCVDATQAVGKIPVDVQQDGIDLMAFSAHKIYGQKGVGALYIRGGATSITLAPLIVGGGQECGLRSGTLNVPGIVGFGEACRLAKEEMGEESLRVARLRDKLEHSLMASLDDLTINGDLTHRLPNTTNIMFRAVDARTLIRDMHCIAVSTKSACSSHTSGPSHVLKAIGLTDDEAYSSIRFSLGRFTTEEEIDFTIERVVASVKKLRHMNSAYAGAG